MNRPLHLLQRITRSSATICCLAIVSVAAPAQAQSAPSPDGGGGTRAARFHAPAGSNVVLVTARDYNFDMARSIPAGLTTFRLRNAGHEPHHFYLVRVDDGKTIADVITALQAIAVGQAEGAPGGFPGWMHPVGGPNAPAPGAASNETVLLQPGSYVAFCVIPSPDGVPHVMKGMITAFTVEGMAGTAELPEPDATITLTDYAFELSSPLTAGPQTVAITNASAQPHELVLTRFQPGTTATDLVDWAYDPRGRPPPGQPYGGVTDIPPGATVDVQLDLEAGDYGLLCFSPDVNDGRPHAFHGMRKDITVR